jgi:hypothetical protein|tara:strand:+ start:457 stop:558 length:102 start_codon:yes stop_codon:yes gene_type:complete
MTLEQGLLMLFFGIVAIAIGGTIAYQILKRVNK